MEPNWSRNWWNNSLVRERVILPKPYSYYSETILFKVLMFQIKKRSNIYTKSKLEKWGEHWPTLIQIWFQIDQQSMHKSIDKSMRNLRSNSPSKIEPWGSPGPIENRTLFIVRPSTWDPDTPLGRRPSESILSQVLIISSFVSYNNTIVWTYRMVCFSRKIYFSPQGLKSVDVHVLHGI